jgi:hypothetical protein
MTAPDRAQAPAAPGRLGQSIPADQLLKYIEALRDWRGQRKAELDRIDEAALRAPDSDSYTADLTLAMTIWQSVSDRLERLETLWDSGRVAAQQREEMSRVIWGTGTGMGAGIGLSLVEAGRLSDALTATLRARLSFDPLATDVAARIAATRATIQRSSEMLASSRVVRPGDVPDLDAMRRRVDELAARASQGSDVTGPFAVLEGQAARAERDLIVRAATHRDMGRDYRATLERRRRLESQEERLRSLVAQVTQAVTPAPRLAVPDVERLGTVPQTREALDTYRNRLDRVALALDMAEQAYASALAERDELRGRLQAYAAMAAARGRSGETVVSAAYDQAYDVLWTTPCPLPQARDLVVAYQRLVSSKPGGGSPS